MQHNSSQHISRDPGYDRFMNFLGSLESDSIPLSERNNNETINYNPVKRYEMDWSCMKLVDPSDISTLWSRTFLLHTDWATGIPEYTSLPREDQAVLFKQNYPGFCWMTHAYKCYVNGQARIGLPLGNGSYLPYSSYEYANLHPILERVYGVVCRRIIDQVVIPMFEMNLTFEEYCIMKTMALFQLNIHLSQHTSDVCLHVQKKLKGALTFITRAMVPEERTRRIERMEYIISNLMVSFSLFQQISQDIGSLEYENIRTLNEEHKDPNSFSSLQQSCEAIRIYNQTLSLYSRLFPTTEEMLPTGKDLLSVRLEAMRLAREVEQNKTDALIQNILSKPNSS